MSELRPFALVRSGDQWLRSSFDGTYLDLSHGIVELAWTTTTADPTSPAPATSPDIAGLAFDHECRLYHAVPAGGRVERLLWAVLDPSLPAVAQAAPVDLFQAEAAQKLGDFVSAAPMRALAEPRGLAVDADDRLFVAESAADRILVYDLWSERLLQRTPLPAGARPTDLAVAGNDVYAVLAGARQIVRLTARSVPSPFALPAGCTQPSRIAVSSGGPAGHIAILEQAGTPAAHVWFTDKGFADFAVQNATDLEWESDSVLVIARQPGADFLRFEIGPGERDELPSFRARGYDGLGLVAVPPGHGEAATPRRIGYWTAAGFRTAVPARLVYGRTGRVTTFRLDSGAYQTVWGRLFLDACIPSGADVRVHYIVQDEDTGDPGAGAELPRVPPSNVKSATILHPDLSPPMPPLDLVPAPGAVVRPLHRRESGRELPWTQPAAGDNFVTYEAPIDAPAGRYLWITLELRSNTRVTPKIKCLRAEHPAHDYLRRLPRTFSRDENAASFLLRYLSLFEGFLGETEARAVDRDLLLDPRSTPSEALPWLASFVGLVLDERWATAPAGDVRRQLVAEAVWLFRYRGTVPGLKRFLEIYIGIPVVLLEHFRLRGLGVPVLGDRGTAESSSVVGYGFRVGGSVGTKGTEEEVALGGMSENTEDAFRTHAHRFTVIIPAVLSPEQLGAVEDILRVHRPAHTLFDVCTVGAGMRAGRALLLGVSSVIGPTGGFSTLQLGKTPLGRDAIVGRPAPGVRVDSGALGQDTVVG